MIKHDCAARQAGEMGNQESPLTLGWAGGRLSANQFCRRKPGGPGGQVEEEPTRCQCSFSECQAWLIV